MATLTEYDLEAIFGISYDECRDDALRAGIHGAAEFYGGGESMPNGNDEIYEAATAHLQSPDVLLDLVGFDLNRSWMSMYEGDEDLANDVDNDLLGYYMDGWSLYLSGDAIPCAPLEHGMFTGEPICVKPGTYCNHDLVKVGA